MDRNVILLSFEVQKQKYRSRTGSGVWGAEETIQTNSCSGNNCCKAPLVVQSDGVVHVVWADNDVHYRRRDASGSWGPAETISNRVEYEFGPRIGLDPSDGSVHVVWTGGYDTTSEYFTAYSSKPLGGSWSSPYFMHETGTKDDEYPYILIGGDGDVHVMYRSGLSNNCDVFYAVRDRSSRTWSSPINVSNHNVSHLPAMTWLAQGYMGVVWSYGPYQEVWYATRSPSGIWDQPYRLERSSSAVYWPRIASVPGVTELVAWEEGPSGGNHAIMYMEKADSLVGGVAEAPDVDASALERAESSHGTSIPCAGLAGAAAGSALLLAAGGWYARRRWLH